MPFCLPFRQTALLTVVLLGLPGRSFESEVHPPSPVALPSRETLRYTVEWRMVTAGKATLSWNASSEAHPGWQTHLHLQSAGLVSRLYQVQDDYSSLLNQELCATSSYLVAQEGNRQRETKVTFDSQTKKASYLETDLIKKAVVSASEVDTPACVHDVLGGLYLLRTLRLEPGQSVQIPVSDGKKSVQARVEAQAREEIRTPSGVYKTVRHEVFLFNNVLYQRQGRLFVWLTDDGRRAPVQIRARLQFHIGTITLILEKEEPT